MNRIEKNNRIKEGIKKLRESRSNQLAIFPGLHNLSCRACQSRIRLIIEDYTI